MTRPDRDRPKMDATRAIASSQEEVGTMGKEAFRAWLNRYVDAWRSGDRAEIGDLFSEDVQYRYGPFHDPVVGRDAVVQSWVDNPDAPGSWEAEYRPLAIDGDVFVATGESRYSNGKTYSNIFVCRFDGDGRCSEFTEWWMQQKS
jgi:ketosteroid isomerase-like protein